MKSATVDRDYILEPLRANRERLREEFGIERIGIYGSFARNEQTEKSDIDLVYD
ncbi:nucleotidyltransferase family protein [Spirosoma fluminis]